METIHVDPVHDNETYRRYRNFLDEETLDIWNDAGRQGIMFIARDDDAPLKLIITGHLRLDDLRIAPIDPRDLPDTSAVRRAVFVVPPERRRGATALAGIDGFDRRHPVQVDWGFTGPPQVVEP
jgi:hypothetical protein